MKRLTSTTELRAGERITFLDETGKGSCEAVHNERYVVESVNYQRGDYPLVIAISLRTGRRIASYIFRFGREVFMEENE